MRSPIQERRSASISQAIASGAAGAGSGTSLRISRPFSKPRLWEYLALTLSFNCPAGPSRCA